MSRRPTPGQLPLVDIGQGEPAPAAVPRSRPGIRYRRRGAADDCAACWANQHAAHVAGRPLPTRNRASWIREEERAPGARGYHPDAGVSRTALCPAHKADRQEADQLSDSTTPTVRSGGHP